MPLDYIPGFILALGTLIAIRNNLKDGKAYQVTASLTRGAMLLHEATDLCSTHHEVSNKTKVVTEGLEGKFNSTRIYVPTKAVGKVGFPYPATVHTKYSNLENNMSFSDGNLTFKTK